MGGEHFIFEPVLVDHDFEIDVNIFAAGQVVGLLFFFLSFQVFHLHPSLLALLLDALDFVERVCLLVLLPSLHIEFQINQI